jgi:UDP-glucuronate decarboxylase
MRLMMTGVSGFIGRAVIPLLANIEVHAITRQQLDTHNSSVHWYELDLFDSQQVDRLIADVQPTHLLHLAWEARPGIYWTSLDNYRWVSASQHLLQAFQQNGGVRAVIAGTCAEYDWRYGYCVENETPLSYATPYAACKSSLYSMLMSFAKQTQLSLTWGRIFFPYGTHENSKRLIPYVIQSLLNNESARTSHGEQFRDFLHITDVASAFVALLKSEVEGAVNIGSGEPVRLKQIIHAIADILDAHHLLQIGAVAATDEAPMVVASVRRLQQEVGWTPTYSLSVGLTETIRWWQSQLGEA